MATVWTGDPARGHRIALRVKAGTVGINMPTRPFGATSAAESSPGSGASSGSRRSMLYLETKSVIVSTGSRPINSFGL